MLIASNMYLMYIQRRLSCRTIAKASKRSEAAKEDEATTDEGSEATPGTIDEDCETTPTKAVK